MLEDIDIILSFVAAIAKNYKKITGRITALKKSANNKQRSTYKSPFRSSFTETIMI